MITQSKIELWRRGLGGGVQSQNGGGIGWEDHFLPHKFIKRSFEFWATFTKQLLNAGTGHQAPRKAVHSHHKEVWQNIKDKKRDKELGMETCPGEGVLKKKFPNSRKPSHRQVCGEFWNLRGQRKLEKTTTTQNMHLTTTASGEVAHRCLCPPPASRGWSGTHGSIISA